MAELKTHKSRIGKGLINMLMFQMYGDEKLIYRIVNMFKMHETLSMMPSITVF